MTNMIMKNLLTVACLLLLLLLPGEEAMAREGKSRSSNGDRKRASPDTRESPSTAKVGFVDYRLLLLEHPLMKRFDPTSHRFRNTVSAFAPDLEVFRDECAEELRAVRSRLGTLEKAARPLLRSGGKQGRDAYSIYWKKRAFLQDEETVLENAIASASRSGNYFVGMTTPDSLLPVIALINRQLRDLVEELRQRKGLDVVLDIAGFSPEAEADGAGALRAENLHWAAWEGKPIGAGVFEGWKRDAWNLLPRAVSYRPPIVAGALDLRAEAVEVLRAWSNPSLDVR